MIKTFIKDHHCHSPLYREIPDEFIDFLMNKQSQLIVPGFIIELAHFEWMELILETEKSSSSTDFIPVQGTLLSCTPVLNPVLHILHYHYPVQNISNSDQYWKNWDMHSESYPREKYILAGLRDSDDEIHFIELNAVTARLIELIQKGLYTGKQALIELATEMHYDDVDSILPFGTEILLQLEEQQIIIGKKNTP